MRRDTQQHGGEKVRATYLAFRGVAPISPRGRWVFRVAVCVRRFWVTIGYWAFGRFGLTGPAVTCDSEAAPTRNVLKVSIYGFQLTRQTPQRDSFFNHHFLKYGNTNSMNIRTVLIYLQFSFAFVSINAYGQCNCPKISREDGTVVTQCNPLPVSGDNSTQIGLSVAANGSDAFVALTVRFAKSASKLAVGSKLYVVLDDNNSVSLTLLKQSPLSIGNSPVTQGIFGINEQQAVKLLKSDIKVVTFTTASGVQRVYQAKQNRDVISSQLNCITSEY